MNTNILIVIGVTTCWITSAIIISDVILRLNQYLTGKKILKLMKDAQSDSIKLAQGLSEGVNMMKRIDEHIKNHNPDAAQSIIEQWMANTDQDQQE